jgi:hypothetical protein
MALKFNNPNSTAVTKPAEPPQQQPEQPSVVTPTPAVKNTPLSQPVHREIGRKKEQVNHPDHYGGKDNPYEVIKVIRAWDLSFSLGNVVKYIARAGIKDPTKRLEDLHKAAWYLQEEISSEYEKGIK